MRYLFLICADDKAASQVGTPSHERSPQAWLDEVQRRGLRTLGGRLRPAAEAKTQRLRDGQVLVSDGPFAETAEQIGGFDVMECADLDEAIEVAAKHPFAAIGSIEIRPLWDE
ncbi:YciI family protein [Labedaea rhizosphaerae]|uniref:YCII-related domain-containing protein n=1 Tax=Labedaea rhizosphaerae TaxID=598644 RepID=A0A4R6SQ29_LABRH|nr:YciI family protein [Labedaea rhizosphaerae]TDQ05363.1 hypothetical protein EV186_1011333 [Labedaea rhizosphaerae]